MLQQRACPFSEMPFAACPAECLCSSPFRPELCSIAVDVEAAVELDGVRYDVGGYNNTCPLWVRAMPHVTHEQVRVRV